MPSARSSASDPVPTTPTSTWLRSPIRMIEPLPNCRSICATAEPMALALSMLGPPLRRMCDGLGNGEVGSPEGLVAGRAARREERIIERRPADIELAFVLRPGGLADGGRAREPDHRDVRPEALADLDREPERRQRALDARAQRLQLTGRLDQV